MKRIRAVVGLSLLLVAYSSSANEILYTVDNLGGNSWQYNYTLNNTGTNVLEEFTVYFDFNFYENLAVVASPAGWDSIVIQPDINLPDDGFFDSLALGLPLFPGEMLAGFSVSFDFLGIGDPGDQFFEYVDPFTFDVLADGFTELIVVDVPEPATYALIGIGLLMMAFTMRRRRILLFFR